MKLALLLVLGVLLAGCSFGVAVDAGRATSDRFLELMSQGKFEQAHELCVGTEVSREDLQAWTLDPGNASMIADYKGVDFASGGDLRTENGVSTLRLPPSPLKGRPSVTVQFTLRKDDGMWKIIGFAMKSGK